MNINSDGVTARRTTFRVTVLSFAKAGEAEFSEVLTYTGQADAHGMPVYSNAVMTASIEQTGSDYKAHITDWPGHTWQDVERVMVTAKPVD